ncbi:hypothetical protein [Catenulispora pinisilvae]|uniref:hypothetical protein n=1 Tax=Catenulispora pinisilvae TaxID=2705253 RepID=UPI001890CBF9|nr:hypothetical protein [Catenulispora pinisilvae]
MSAPNSEPMVDNPDREWLRDLLNQVNSVEPEMYKALDDAASKMGSGSVWTSPPGAPGDTFMHDVQGRQQRLHRIMGDLAGEVQAALNKEPLQMPMSQATALRRE